jgi:short-subunit dehydrogenase
MEGKVVIVTGASSGIGLAISKEFARLGAKVVLAARSTEKLNEVAQDIFMTGGDAFVITTDVSVENDCKNLVERTIEHYGRLDILINNAGVSMRALFNEALNLDVIKTLMDVNFWGAVYCTRYALPHLLNAKGSLVGISSVAGFHGLPGRSGYSASKFALHGFLETIRIENLKNDLHVMVLSAGFTKSNIRVAALTSNAQPQGFSPRNEDNMMLPEQVAKYLIKAIKRKKRNRILTSEGKLTALFQRIVPTFVDWVAYQKMAKENGSPLK